MAINTGDLPEGKERSSHWRDQSKSRTWAGVRASVVAQASGREQEESPTERRRVTIAGAKGRRKMDTRRTE